MKKRGKGTFFHFIFLKVLLLEALKENRCDYVRVLLDKGVKLKKKNLPELYAQVNCQLGYNFPVIVGIFIEFFQYVINWFSGNMYYLLIIFETF